MNVSHEVDAVFRRALLRAGKLIHKGKFMSKTTPEEAIALARKYGSLIRGIYPGAFRFQPHELAALIDEVRGVGAEPVAWRHRDPAWSGWATTNEQWKANLPIGWEEEPLYTHPAPSQPAAPVELPVVGALWEYIGKDPMRHQIKPCARGLHEMNPDSPPYPDNWKMIDKVVKLSDAQAAIAAAQKLG